MAKNNRQTRLEKAVNEYYPGVVFISAYSGIEYTSKGFLGEYYEGSTRRWHIIDYKTSKRKAGQGNGVIYDASSRKWAKIIYKPNI